MDTAYDIVRMLGVALGIGFIIFVHELGHFLAARWCGVRVEVFSIGFGPALWSWRRGATRYKLGAVPLGGYVKMAGDDGVPAGRAAPDQLPAKSVGQRFFIYSGGVLMNLAFAVVVFPVLFAVGVPFLRPVLGEPLPGGPAWDAGLEAGTEVVAVNGHHVYDFTHIPTEVALGDAEGAELEIREPGSETTRVVRVVPEYRESLGFYSIDVGPALDPERRIEVRPGSPAAEAGLRSGERLVDLPDAPEGLGLRQQLQLAMSQGGTLRVEVAGGEGARTVSLEPRPITEGVPPRLGIQPPYRHVLGVRDSAATRALGLREDDRIVAVDGEPLWRLGDLPRLLSKSSGERSVTLEREGERITALLPPLTAEERAQFISDVALVNDAESTVLVIEPDSPAERAGLVDGDRVTHVDTYPVEDWADVRNRVLEAGRRGRSLELSVVRGEPGGEVSYLKPVVTPEVIPLHDYGFDLLLASYVYRVGSPLAALRVGVACSWKLVQDSWFTLKGILFGNVSGENVGGIITIGAVSYHWAESGLAKLLFFLCMLSVNVAFINVLPVPVLDGGHLFFLIVEKIKGSPVSERVLGYSQMVGLVLILSLMVYVTFNDIARWFFE